MSQHDYDIANGDGATVRADINSVLQAIAENNSGATAPSVTFPNMWWFDTSNNQLKQRDNANTAWITIGTKVGTTWTAALGTNAVAEAAIINGAVAYAKMAAAALASETEILQGTASKLVTAANLQGAFSLKTLTDSGSVSPNFTTGNSFLWTFGAGNRTLANPTHGFDGQGGVIIIRQDSVGGRTLSLGSDWKTADGGGITLTSGPNDYTILGWFALSSSYYFLSEKEGFAG